MYLNLYVLWLIQSHGFFRNIREIVNDVLEIITNLIFIHTPNIQCCIYNNVIFRDNRYENQSVKGNKSLASTVRRRQDTKSVFFFFLCEY